MEDSLKLQIFSASETVLEWFETTGVTITVLRARDNH